MNAVPTERTIEFPLGVLTATKGVCEWAAESELHREHVIDALRRHARGDWGDIPEEDREVNLMALVTGERLFSAYDVGGNVRLYVITEADRSVTTVLFPDEY